MRTRTPFPRRTSHPRPGSPILIGRGSGCDIVLDSWTVSRRHAQLRREGGRWILEDLHSTNGTGLNGRLVEEPIELHDGDILTFGIVGMRFSAAGDRHLV